MLYIKTNSNNTNKKEDLMKLRNNYDGVMNKIKNKNERKLFIKLIWIIWTPSGWK
jgi:hypothetical protein